MMHPHPQKAADMLEWLANRLTNQYLEHDRADYILTAHRLAAELRAKSTAHWSIVTTGPGSKALQMWDGETTLLRPLTPRERIGMARVLLDGLEAED